MVVENLKIIANITKRRKIEKTNKQTKIKNNNKIIFK